MLVAQGSYDSEEGIEGAFTLVSTVHETVSSGIWINDIFFFINSQGKINYTINGLIFNYNFTDKKKYIVGYV
jgi:coatomer subunit beta'